MIFFSSDDNEWLNTEFHAGNTTSGLANEMSSYCVDSEHPWVMYNGTEWIQSRNIITTCANIKCEPFSRISQKE